MYDFGEKSWILHAKNHQGVEIEELGSEQHIQNTEMMLMTKPFKMEDLMQNCWNLDQAQSNQPSLRLRTS